MANLTKKETEVFKQCIEAGLEALSTEGYDIRGFSKKPL